MECFLCSKLEEKNRLNLDIVQTLFKLKLLAFTHVDEFECSGPCTELRSIMMGKSIFIH
jgi:hypothetical protein